jgi:DnaJ-domain-containing protein 1
MGIFDRFGTMINSYFNDYSDQTKRSFKTSNLHNNYDPDFETAYEELNDFLNNKKSRSEKSGYEYSGFSSKSDTSSKDPNLPPEELRDDFEKLGVHFGADTEACKTAYKKLIKLHHPDRHAGHENNFKKATERTARINASWDRINKWHQGKK